MHYIKKQDEVSVHLSGKIPDPLLLPGRRYVAAHPSTCACVRVVVFQAYECLTKSIKVNNVIKLMFSVQ